MNNEITKIKKYVQSLEKRVQEMEAVVYAMKNTPKFKPFDKIITPNFDVEEDGSIRRKSVEGIIVTEAHVCNNKFAYQVRIDNKIQNIFEDSLTNK